MEERHQDYIGSAPGLRGRRMRKEQEIAKRKSKRSKGRIGSKECLKWQVMGGSRPGRVSYAELPSAQRDKGQWGCRDGHWNHYCREVVLTKDVLAEQGRRKPGDRCVAKRGRRRNGGNMGSCEVCAG